MWGWLCPKRKDAAADVMLDGLRPLILLEVLRKLWVGLVIRRITRAWERYHVLADDSAAARRRSSCNSSMRGNIRRKRVPRSTPLRLRLQERYGTQLVSPGGPHSHGALAGDDGRWRPHGRSLPLGTHGPALHVPLGARHAARQQPIIGSASLILHSVHSTYPTSPSYDEEPWAPGSQLYGRRYRLCGRFGHHCPLPAGPPASSRHRLCVALRFDVEISVAKLSLAASGTPPHSRRTRTSPYTATIPRGRQARVPSKYLA